MDVQSLVGLELARWSEGGQLHVDALRAIILLATFCAPALLHSLVLVLWVDDPDNKRTLGPVILGFDSRSLARGGHRIRNERRRNAKKMMIGSRRFLLST